MHILLISDNFYPETNAPASRGYEHCKIWVTQGNKVTVITSFPNYPKGKIFSGYKNKLRQKETIDGINIIRVWTYMAPNAGVWKRMLDHMSFMISSFVNGIFLKNIDIIVGTSPHLFTPLSAMFLAKIKQKFFMLELRDLWPDSMLAVGINNHRNLYKIAKFLEKKLYLTADKIIPVTYSFKKYLINLGIPNNKIRVVMNGVDTDFFNFKKSKYIKRSSKIFKISYIGTIGLAHSIQTIIEAAKIFNNRHSELKILFQIIGDGAEKEKILKEAQGNSNVKVLSTITKDQVKEYLDRTDAGVIHLRKNNLYKTVVPSKMFEYMAMGVPILHGVSGESLQIINKYNLGLHFQSESPEDLCSAILELYNNKSLYNKISENCVKASKIFNRKILALKMLEEIKKFEK